MPTCSRSSVEAARARATLGEISAGAGGCVRPLRHRAEPVKGIYGGAYEGDPRWARAEAGVAAIERRLGRKPRMLVAKMGQDGHDRGANLVASAFADLGFEVVPGPLFQTPRRAPGWRSRRRSTWSAPRASPPATRPWCPS
jgi:methylmalonyl-CoA mutase